MFQRSMFKSSAAVALLVSGAGLAQATVIPFDLMGRGGAGLLPTNENHTVNGAGTSASGGEIGAGITYDTVTKQLTINVGWGTTNGFTNLSGVATLGHIHGPTASGGAAAFTQNAGVRLGLDSGPTWNTSASAGGVFGRVLTLDATQEAELLAGRWYLNFHTSLNGPGEIRGQLVQVPTPGAGAILGLSMIVAGRRRRA
jgi:hypothetical protein